MGGVYSGCVSSPATLPARIRNPTKNGFSAVAPRRTDLDRPFPCAEAHGYPHLTAPRSGAACGLGRHRGLGRPQSFRIASSIAAKSPAIVVWVSSPMLEIRKVVPLIFP